MSDLLFSNFSDSILGSWATAICFFDVHDPITRSLVNHFNKRGLRADKHMLQHMLENGCVCKVASHPLLYTLQKTDFEKLVFRCRSVIVNHEILCDLLFAITLHRMRFPENSTIHLDQWVRRCALHPSRSVRCQALEARALLTNFTRSDKVAIAYALSRSSAKAEATASVRALWNCLQKDKYKKRFIVTVSDKKIGARMMQMARQQNTPETKDYLAEVLIAIKKAYSPNT